MRGRVIAVLLLVLSFSSIAESQCNWTPRYSGQFRTTAYDISLDNDYLWLATGYGVTLYRRNATSVTPLDSVALPGSTRVVRASGNGYAYAGSGSRLYVLHRNGTQIDVVRFLDAGGTINDFQIQQGADLFIATSKGAAHYSLIPADAPVKSNAIFATSSQNVSTIAISGDTLYTADGDASVEVFNIAIPSLSQKTDQLTSVSAATAVHTADNFVFVSDRFGQTTDVFTGTTRLARLTIGSNAFAPSSARVHFVAGPDRTIRAVDFNDLTRTPELYETTLAPTDGTDNTIHAMARSGDAVYVAAGDMGLVTLDASPLAKPSPMAGYGIGATTSSVVVGDTAWVANASGTISEQKINPQGLSLTQTRTWSTGANALVHDFDNNTLLTSSGATATLWSTTPATPTASLTVTFPANVTKAMLRGNTIVALLEGGAVYTANSATPQAVSVPAMTSIARSGSAIALMQILKEGQTVIHHYANGDLGTAARTYTLNGVAIGNLALDATRAAVFLFNGVNVIDLASGAPSVISGSDRTFPIQLAFAGDDLLVLADKTLYVYDDAKSLAHALPLTANAIAFSAAAPYAVIASSEGVIASLYLRDLPQTKSLTSSSFYTKMLADGDRLYLFSRDGIDIHSTATSLAPHFFTSIRAANIVDVATTTGRIYTLSGGSNVTAYSHAGTPLAQVTINEGIDQQPLSITTAGNAVWVSISKGCLSGQCERKTVVLDPQTLLVTDSFSGQVVDVATSGSRAYVLADSPDEVRIVNIADPLHPGSIAAVAAPPTARSLAYSANTIYILGDKVYAFNDTTLTSTGSFLTAIAPTNTHQIRTAGTCALIAGRASNPELYTLPAFTAGNSFDVPSNVRGMIVTASRVLLLTEHSIEVWSTSGDDQQKRRAAR